MGFKCGIVGLPNVGKSTLFNALVSAMMAEAANYPFCTIEPNVGKVGVPDERLDNLAALAKSAKVVPAQIEFVDIAGLVRGASKGEGLGNQFLGHIREVNAIAYVLRCFEDPDVTHVEGSVDPIRDAQTIETELMLADLESLQKRLPNLEKKARIDKEAAATINDIKEVIKVLETGQPATSADVEPATLQRMQLLTSKPVLYVCNVDESDAASGNSHSAKVAEYAASRNADCVVISAKIEAEIAMLESPEDRSEFLSSLGLECTGLSKLVRAGYRTLKLITFFTIGPKEARAWTIHEGTLAPQSAGVIHTDFERGFIRAEVISHDDYMKYKGEAGARDAGRLRSEGKEYKVCDGDVLHFKFNV
ncbi:MAG: redox-regulated ATPase YchF [Proteobacteria bacterium]|nr:redox-regulated ATPase YchF [Pseudomonadota bacterium]